MANGILEKVREYSVAFKRPLFDKEIVQIYYDILNQGQKLGGTISEKELSL